jgi:hypothetical protein
MKRLAMTPSLAFCAALAACRGGPAPRPLSAADREVKKVQISRGQETFVLVQDEPGTWRVLPPDDAVDPAEAAALLDGLRGLKPQTRLSGQAAAYGLSPSDATSVRASGAAGETLFAARFGRRGLGDAVHMAAGDRGEAYLGAGPAAELLGRGAQEWRDRRLLRGPCADVEVDAGRGWRAAAPATASSLCALRATAILPPMPDFLAGLDRPVLRVRSSSGSFAAGALLGGERWISGAGRAALLRAPAAPLAAALVEERASRGRPGRGIMTK